jgi:glycosyltransferase involved in cell wall biosynthesis
MTPKQGHQRGIIETICSLTLLREKCPDIVFFVLGNKESFPWIKAFSKEYGVEDRVILHDKVDYMEVPKYIALCDVGMVPLQDIWIWRNQSPLKLLEYLAMQKVVVATDIPCNRYVLGDCQCAVYIPRANPEDIAKGILFAYQNRAKLAEWGKSGRPIVNAKYSWAKVAADFEKYLLTIDA